MKSRLKSWHACTSLWGTELVIEFRLESHEILTNAETDWLTDWGLGFWEMYEYLRWTFFPWSSCFPVIVFCFLTRRTPPPPPPPFLNGPPVSVDFHIRVFFYFRKTRKLYVWQAALKCRSWTRFNNSVYVRPSFAFNLFTLVHVTCVSNTAHFSTHWIIARDL